jgi:two-component system phosphate regulon response regulator OmpR
MNVPQILAVYDDVEIRVLLSRYILEPGFRVQLASRCSKVMGGGRI